MQQLVILQLSWRRCTLQACEAFNYCNRNNEPCTWKTNGINHLSFRIYLSPPLTRTYKVNISKQFYREYFSFLLKRKCQTVLSGLLQSKYEYEWEENANFQTHSFQLTEYSFQMQPLLELLLLFFPFLLHSAQWTQVLIRSPACTYP